MSRSVQGSIAHQVVWVLIVLVMLALATTVTRGVAPTAPPATGGEVQTFTTDPPPVEFNGRLVVTGPTVSSCVYDEGAVAQVGCP